MEPLYLIQHDNDKLETEIISLVLNHYDNYEFIDYDELDKSVLSNNTIPIGNINFVSKALKKIDPIFETQIPIEIPTYLQTDEFLKRYYKIGTWKDIPKTGRWFIKDASELKSLSICENMNIWYNEEMFDYKPQNEFDCSICLPKSHNYIISSPFNIKAEYRLYIIDQKLVNISLYKGDPIYNPDMNLITKAIELINSNEKYLKSYSLDIMVNDKFETAIIEVHDFTSLGLYTTIWDREESNLLLAYKQGIEYLLKDNQIKYL